MWWNPLVVNVFVYGTLRTGGVAAGLIPGARRPAVLADHALYGRTHPYPFVVARPGSMVHGELVEVDAGLLSRLDEYEGDEYRRARATVTTADGPLEAEVWVAVSDPPLVESELIVGGDWFDR